MGKRTKFKITDSRFQGLRTHTKKSVDICTAIRTTTTGYLWWKKSKIAVVFAVMLAEEDTSYHASLNTYTDYHWKVVDYFEDHAQADKLRNKILYGEGSF